MGAMGQNLPPSHLSGGAEISVAFNHCLPVGCAKIRS
jgi:hypothetical protein